MRDRFGPAGSCEARFARQRLRCAARRTDSLRAQAGGELDLHGDVERQLGHPDRTACVAARVPEDFNQKVRAAINHRRSLVKTRGAIDHSKHPDHALDPLQTTELCVQRREDREPRHARGLLPLLQREIPPNLSLHLYGPRDRSVSTDMHDASVDHACEVVPSRWKRRRKLNPKLPETINNHRGRLTGDDRFQQTIPPQHTMATSVLVTDRRWRQSLGG